MHKSLLAFLLLLPTLAYPMGFDGAEASPSTSQPADRSTLTEPDLSPLSFYGFFENLSGEKKGKARKILEDSMPSLRNLDRLINLKMQELEALTYDDGLEPEALAKLGLELQKLRQQLYLALSEVNSRLQKETGISVLPPASRGCRSMRFLYQQRAAQ